MMCGIAEYSVNVGCLCCIANATGEDFVPYFHPVIDVLKVHLVDVNTEDQRKVQIQAVGNAVNIDVVFLLQYSKNSRKLPSVL